MTTARPVSPRDAADEVATVLLVEPDGYLRLLPTEELEEAHYCVLSAPGGRDALEAWARAGAHLAVLNGHTLGSSELQLMGTLLEQDVRFPHHPAGWTAPSLCTTMCQTGNLRVIPKRSDPRELMEMIRSLLEQGNGPLPRERGDGCAPGSGSLVLDGKPL